MVNVKSPLLNDSNDEASESDSTVCVTTKVSVDEALESIGSYGPFQLLLQLLFMYYNLSISYQIVLSYFIGDNPPWKCTFNSTRNSSNKFCLHNHGREIPVDTDNFYERCKLSRGDWTYTTDKMYSYITEFDLVCERKALGALASGAIFIGGLLQIFTGSLMDIYGRKLIIIICLLVNICITITCSFVTSVWQLICLRVALGTTLFTCYTGGMLLLGEFIIPKARALSVIVYSVAFTISLFLIDAGSYYERHWRKLNLYACVPSMFALLTFLFIPQSPRWLLGNKQISKAEKVLEKIYDWNGKPAISVSLISTFNPNKKIYTYLDFVRNWKLLLMASSLGILYASMALVYYEIALEASQLGGNIYISFALSAISDIPSYFIALYLCNWLGRKKTVSGSLLLSGIMIGLISVIPRHYSYRYTASVTLAMISKVFVNIGFMGLYLWAFELFPTVLRSQGCSICGVIERAGTLCVPLLTTYLNSINPVLIFIVVGVVAVCASLIGYMLRETNNLPTRENYEDLFVDNKLN